MPDLNGMDLPDLNPITEVRKKGDGTITVERTPEFPVTDKKVYVIADILLQIKKIDSVLAVWNARREPLQAIVDEYEVGK